MAIKVLFKDDTTLSDISVNLDNYYAGTETLPFVAAEDFLYIGSRFPFNHLYFKFGTANTASSSLTVAVWDGNQWRNTVQTFDETLSGAASFGQDGYITWIPDKQYGWGREDTTSTSGNEQVTGLGDITIYDHYWVRFAFSADLDAGTALSWVGNLFTDDNDLGTEFPDLVRTNVLTAWESGKTTWEEQHVHAAKIIAQDLESKKVIVHKSQILDRKDYIPASIMKVAEFAFRGMGPEFVDDRNDSRMEYEKRLNKTIGKIDRDLDGTLDRRELGYIQGRLRRGGPNL